MMDFRRSKIVCTLGPATQSRRMIAQLVRAGMDVARLNFSHGTHAWHAQMITLLRDASSTMRKPLAILADLGGPKIRTGALAGGNRVTLRTGQRFTISTGNRPGDVFGVSTSFRTLPREVHRGGRILLADGLIELRVSAVRLEKIICEVVNGGERGEHQGINLPGAELKVPSLLPKDYDDLSFALKHGVNYVAVSFVRRSQDVEAARRAIRRAGMDTPIIAKLEKPQAIANLDAILDVADGVMVARGDLGVEMSPEVVPVLQKKIIDRARDARRPVITATQMLESMTENPRPTRAEASDVANAIFDGTDVVMLSGETASGRYPRETVAMMVRIILEAEASIAQLPPVPRRRREEHRYSVAETICESIAHAAEDLPMGAIAVFTESGNRMNALWGVHPVHKKEWESAEAMLRTAEKELLPKGLLRAGDVLGLVAGTKLTSGATNFMRLHTVGESDRALRKKRKS